MRGSFETLRITANPRPVYTADCSDYEVLKVHKLRYVFCEILASSYYWFTHSALDKHASMLAECIVQVSNNARQRMRDIRCG